jgi:hypothetical protein
MRGVRYALWAYGTATTAQILEWAYPWPGKTPRQRHNQRRAVRHAAKQLAIAIGRSPTGKGRPVIWRLKEVSHPTTSIEMIGEFTTALLQPTRRTTERRDARRKSPAGAGLSSR